MEKASFIYGCANWEEKYKLLVEAIEMKFVEKLKKAWSWAELKFRDKKRKSIYSTNDRIKQNSDDWKRQIEKLTEIKISPTMEWKMTVQRNAGRGNKHNVWQVDEMLLCFNKFLTVYAIFTWFSCVETVTSDYWPSTTGRGLTGNPRERTYIYGQWPRKLI